MQTADELELPMISEAPIMAIGHHIGLGITGTLNACFDTDQDT